MLSSVERRKFIGLTHPRIEHNIDHQDKSKVDSEHYFNVSFQSKETILVC
jgi:hypothetical protein